MFVAPPTTADGRWKDIGKEEGENRGKGEWRIGREDVEACSGGWALAAVGRESRALERAQPSEKLNEKWGEEEGSHSRFLNSLLFEILVKR